MDFKNLKQVQLKANTVLTPFACKEEDLNNFLFEDAKSYTKELLAVTYLLVERSTNDIVAYFSLLADKISFLPESKSKWNKINRNIPNSKRRRSYPAIKIGRLAVNEKYASQGIGTFLLDRLKYRFIFLSQIGCRFLTVDALKSAESFYLKNGFEFFTETDIEDDARLMFFDLKNFTL